MRIIFSISLFLAAIEFVFAQSYTENVVYTESLEDALTVQLSPEKVVFLENEAKPLILTITNTSLAPVTINLQTEQAHNLKVDVFDELDFPVSIAPQLPVKRNSPPIPNPVTLSPDMSTTLEFYLDDFVEIETPGVYSIVVLFYPLQFGKQAVYSVSNSILISVLKEYLYHDDVQVDVDTELEFLNDYTLDLSSPDKTVTLALRSLKELRNNADKVFFSTVDLRSLYLNISQSSDLFSGMNVTEQREELLSFAKRLLREETMSFLQQRADYSIEETRYSASKALITALVQKRGDFRYDIRKYTFHLEKHMQRWKIVNYNVQFVGNKNLPNINAKSRLQSNLGYILPADFVEKESQE